MFKVDVDGKEIWHAYLIGDGGFLSYDDRDALLVQTIRGYRDSKEIIRLKGEEFEGHLKKGKFVSANGYSGRNYYGKLESDKGEREVSIVLRERDLGNQN